jgi:hypothetical protein
MTDTSKLITQLRALVLLTQTEEQVARTRVMQARTDAVRRELTQNADNAAERTQAITQELRRLGGVPDVVTPAIGRLAAVLKATFEQGSPLDEALLGDLQLEHQLVDRATYLKVLAQTAEDQALVELAERLVTAHKATVEWLTVVLAEEALGGPAALVATPFQRVAGGASRVVNLPVRFLANTVNRAIDSVQQAGEETGERVSEAAGKAATFTGAVRESLTVGRNATLRRAERVAEREGADATADAVKATRREVGDLTADEMPIKGFDSLTTNDAAKAVKGLRDPKEINAMIRYEETHKKRSSVISAAQTALASAAKEAVGVSD